MKSGLIASLVLAVPVALVSSARLSAQTQVPSEAELRRLAVSALENGIAIGDFDEDGHLDLLVANDAGPRGISLFHTNANGTFSAPELVPDATGFCVTRIVSGDFDRDHHLDLALFHPNGLTILRGNGKGTFTWSSGAEHGEIDPARANDDPDGDGKLHLPSVLLYANLLIISHGKGELVYTNLALYSHGLFVQDPDGGEDGALDATPDDHFIPD